MNVKTSTDSGRISAKCAVLLSCALVTFISMGERSARAEDAPRRSYASYERRFAVKAQSFSISGFLAAPVRRSLYTGAGFGAELQYHPTENLGWGLRWMHQDPTLNDQAQYILATEGQVPDARPQFDLFLLTCEPTVGYAKLRTGKRVLHFEPVLRLGLGAARGERRVMPSANLGLGFRFHFLHGLQATLGLDSLLQLEDRTRGWVSSMTFLPTLAFGWSSARRAR